MRCSASPAGVRLQQVHRRLLGSAPAQTARLHQRRRIAFRGENILGFDDERLRSYRWRQASVVFQSAMNALNPVLRMEEQFCDVLLAHNPA